MSFIEANNLSFKYAESDRCALSIDRLSVEKGELVLMIGPSGSGKTTLLRRIVDETGYKGERGGDIEVQARSYGYVWQEIFAQPVSHRVESELVFGMENKGYEQAYMERRLAEIVAFFGLEDMVHREISSLSAGELQTVNIAAAITEKPELLLLDEPTGSLDPMAAERLAGLIRKINESLGITVIIAEQRPELFYEMADRILFLEDGHVLFDGDYIGYLGALATRKEGVEYRDLNRLTGDYPHREEKMSSYLPESVNMSLQLGAKPEDISDIRRRRRWWQESEEAEKYIENKKKDDLSQTNQADKNGIKHDREAAVTVKNVYYRYEKNAPDVLKRCCFTLHKGRITALVGGNGSGKTTLAEIIAGIIKPYKGSVRCISDGKKSYDQDDKRENRSYKNGGVSVSYLPADPGLLYTGEPFDGSGGEKEWHGIETVMGREADIYILDEPTTGLDPEKKQKLLAMVNEKRDAGFTVLLVTHDVEFAARTADDMAMMYDGRIVACESKEAFLRGNVFYTTELQRLSL